MRLVPLFAVVISQIAPNPSLPEPAAEFVVVQNTGQSVVLLDGMRLTDATGAVRGVVPPDTSLEPGQRIALQPAAGATVYGCGGKPYRALLTAWPPLNNDGDSVALEAPNGTVLDRVTYGRDAYATDSDVTPCGIAPPRHGAVVLAESSSVVSEGAGSATLRVRRTDGSNGRVVVPFATLDGSARAGSDYERAEGAVTLAAGQDSASFEVPLRADSADEADETFTVVLRAPGGGATLSEPSRATVMVRDDDPPAPAVATPVVTPPRFPAATAPSAFAAPAPPPPPAAAPAVPAAPPLVSAAVASWQPLLRRGGIAVAVRCDRDCTVRAEARIALGGGRHVALAPTRRALGARVVAVLRPTVRARHVRALRRALRRRGSLTATVTVAPAGGQPVDRRTRIR